MHLIPSPAPAWGCVDTQWLGAQPAPETVIDHGSNPQRDRKPQAQDDPEDIFRRLERVDVPEPLRDPVVATDLEHRDFETGEFWRHIPAFSRVDSGTFLDTRFQNMHTVTRAAQLGELLAGHVAPSFLADVEEGLRVAPMALRLSPYLLSLIDWENPYADPIRRQFLPVASTRLPDHPMLTLDSLAEQDDSPVPGLVHRYPDKALFLALDVCPVYCRFCTRSYAIGLDTAAVEKVDYKSQPKRWEQVFAYLASRPEIEDVVVSGGDVYNLSAARLDEIGRTLLAIPHIRRIRFATKGPAVMPMKILADRAWSDALTGVVDQGRAMGKEVAVHTHFNTPNEITDITRRAMHLLFRRGVKVRNQAVLIRGVNDDADVMTLLVRRLAWMNVQPYYVYQHDLVQGVEELRTRVADTLEIERTVRGSTAGFNTPTFVVDAPGGGGKRDVHSFDHYDETTGVSVYRSPAVDADRVYLYFDPLDLLPEEGRARWADPNEHERILEEALVTCGLKGFETAMPPGQGRTGRASTSRRPTARQGDVAPPTSARLDDSRGGGAEVVDDPHNHRIKVLGATPASFDAAEAVIGRFQEAAKTPRTKLTVYAFPGADDAWDGRGFGSEATIRGYFQDGRDAHLVARYTGRDRAFDPSAAEQDEIVALARGKAPLRGALPDGLRLRSATESDVPMLAAFLRSVFPDYPTSLADAHIATLVRTVSSRFQLVVDENEQLLACASAEVDRKRRSAEITDCATRPDARGRGLMVALLRSFEKALPAEEGIRDLYTIARAGEVGMNCAFARAGYDWTGRLVNNCRMPDGFESMNVWCRRAAEGGAPESR